MSSVVLTGDTSGAGTITVPAVAGTFTATIGSATGTHYPFTAGTAVASTSGTSIDFTSIPSWVKRITVMFNGVSTSGTAHILFQLGTGSTTYTTSGYLGAGLVGTSAGNSSAQGTTGFLVWSNSAAFVFSGSITFSNLNGNAWTASGVFGRSDAAAINTTGGVISLGAALTAVRITTSNGTDTFDAGSINILYE